MSRESVIIKLTDDQKKLVNAFIEKPVTEVLLPIGTSVKVMLYGIWVPAKKNQLVKLTTKQKQYLKDKHDITCDYLELTKDLKYR